MLGLWSQGRKDKHDLLPQGAPTLLAKIVINAFKEGR